MIGCDYGMPRRLLDQYVNQVFRLNPWSPTQLESKSESEGFFQTPMGRGRKEIGFIVFSKLRGGAQYSKHGDLNDPGSLRVGGYEGRDVLDHYHNVTH